MWTSIASCIFFCFLRPDVSHESLEDVFYEWTDDARWSDLSVAGARPEIFNVLLVRGPSDKL